MIKLFRTHIPNLKNIPDAEQPIESTDLIISKNTMLQQSVMDLFGFLKAFALEIHELQFQRYKDLVDQLVVKFQQIKQPDHLKTDFDRHKSAIQTFIHEQCRYIQDREKELRDIIDLLTKAMAHLNAENRDFYQHVYDQGEKIMTISLLDDIKKIRQDLQQEIEQMRSVITVRRENERKQIQSLAGRVSELQTELEQVRLKSMTDGLTGTFNRQALDEQIADQIEHSMAGKSGFCLLLLDLDNFKAINDKFGHPIGDRMLIAFTQKCRQFIRDGDFFARYGGEEFAIILNHINLRDGLKKASEICKVVAAARYATDEWRSDDFMSITVSIGVSPYNKDDTPESLLARADKALYEAKRKGKNMAIGRKA